MPWILLSMAVDAWYVRALPAANVFYIGNVLLHPLLGLAAVVWVVWKLFPLPSRARQRAVFALLALATILGAYLFFAGATFDHRMLLWAHVAFAIVGLWILFPRWSIALAVLAIAAAGLRFGLPKERIRNPERVPMSMTEEGDGPKSPFWPSSARTNTGGLSPSDFFMASKLCGGCHKEIHLQWERSRPASSAVKQ